MLPAHPLRILPRISQNAELESSLLAAYGKLEKLVDLVYTERRKREEETEKHRHQISCMKKAYADAKGKLICAASDAIVNLQARRVMLTPVQN